MTAFVPGTARQELRRLLATATGKVRRAAIGHALWSNIDRAALVAACVGAISVIALRLGWEPPAGPPWQTYAISIAVVSALGLVFAAVKAAMRRPSLAEVAERLDLGAGAHNQIATALDLAKSPAPNAFALAAVEQGICAAERLARGEPQVPPAQVQWQRAALFAALALVFGVVYCWPLNRLQTNGAPVPGTAHMATPELALNAAEARAIVTPPRPELPIVVAARVPSATDAELARAPASSKQTAAAGGRMSPASAAAATASDQPATFGAETSGTGGKSGNERSGRAQRRPPTTAPPDAPENQPPPASGSSASSSAGSAGGLCRSPVQQDSTQRDFASDDSQEPDADEPTPDESKSATQRGGIQPLLKDRNASPARDLGISDAQGPPGGEGRGGPTPPKKSRGTASLVLGVPAPDFVRGRLGPGPTKVSRERVPPVAAPGEATAAAPAAARTQAEAALPQPTIPAALATRVRDYLVALHTYAVHASETERAPTSPREETP